MERRYIVVRGIVQGVGFRPFVYREAVKNGLKGWVKNTSKGVYIDVEGDKNNIYKFLQEIKINPPPLSLVEKIEVSRKEVKQYKSFNIEKSNESNSNSITIISPDIAICKQCEEDIKNPNNRRYKYPFTNCTNCGPRYSIIEKLPYDREMTTMKEFNMCSSCKEEYKNPLNRRFHAQPNACKECGPKVWLADSHGNIIEEKQAIEKSKELLKHGKIIAVKGLGGFHLVCNGKDEIAIKILRERKRRPFKSLALMMKNMDTVKKYCEVSPLEETVLNGIKKPILLLQRKNSLLPKNISPDNNNLGIMLPYTPLHILLFDNDLEVLIMTSANSSGLPMVYSNKEALEGLNEIVDYFLLHDRNIYMPVDDSVVKVIMNKEYVIRSARGYAPGYLHYEGIEDTLACGSELKNTFAISKGNSIFISPHIGDMSNFEVYNSFKKGIEHFKNIYNIAPKRICFDMHPHFMGNVLSKRFEGRKVPIQHHHAHIVSCMVENRVKDEVIGVAYDGTGYGLDGKIWGSEFLITSLGKFKRVGHLDYIPLPGGQQAIEEPFRIGLSYIYKCFGEEWGVFLPWKDFNDKYLLQNIIKIIKKNVNCIETSSMGRFFDGVASLLNLKKRITYEGEAAIALENICNPQEKGVYNYDIVNHKGEFIIKEEKIIKGILKDLFHSVEKGVIAKKFHNTIIELTVDMCKKIRNVYRIDKVALSGGVFQNNILILGTVKKLQEEGFKVYTHSKIPCNDGGVSLGQLIIGNYNIFKDKLL
ncbi:hydrogenase maturation protein HypF [Clostridium tetanomorphum]|uniref:Carbamoyltransferase n=3 Tax=Clostridium tetanomorphum TaxID=1553 RepID=A0A923E7E7_CLOTT|nr:carbamoyltransferase HypF [Clostridium tetanomorphum]KAJ51354.1 carbamoyltransferase HypF2 [Clostridium tetanomorphum DSM 665]MBC2396439.1 carbamoyltransferase HypF [Clostridium tetanomorphum]MBP1863331.1 hydrogenase maturation protein HypF [Clostridium tetanomorphum]NRS83428.1 hydrogenase maturation protein HypF [Clostridium tetanomorphum]NRZ96628.1 hydrogenase maturation protein HypF [Clostridium tetanomorphum]